MAIANYLTQRHKSPAIISKINKITHQIITCNTLTEFAQLMEYHEILMSEILETTTIKERFFSDFDGVIKSLGAWGGDFIMVIAPENPTQYFKDKGFDVLLSYDELILQ